MTPSFTYKQGQYLAFVHSYTKLNRRPPAETDLRCYFGTTPPTVHNMIIKLHETGFISREPGKARTIRGLVPAEKLPALE
ncbi:MAG: MarR family transcriptional regulator [Planctomycetes bacterium]|nr:MarR family transcriptional regulator [Planctomycetota bacterium]